MQHQSVMLQEVIDTLAIRSDGIYIDATFGRGGHSKEILKRLGSEGRLFAIDKDPEAIAHGNKIFADDARFHITHAPFSNLLAIAEQHGIVGKVDGILLDLGVSSPQLDNPERGFSFLQDGPLDMRMDTTQANTAAKWLAKAKESEIVDVLFKYGEERFARRIAHAIVRERELQPIETTAQLAAIVRAANPKWEKHKNPATRSFQALRIVVNKELTEVSECLEQSLKVLTTSGRLVVLSFHSLEDRIVKRFIRHYSREEKLPKNFGAGGGAPAKLRNLIKATSATEAELAINPRARSAVLRAAELI